MSDIVKSTAQTASPATTRKRKGKAKAEEISVNANAPNAKVDLVDVAIAAADAPFAAATRVFNDRYTENLQAFAQHVEGSTQQVSEYLIGRIYKQYDTTAGDIYGQTED